MLNYLIGHHRWPNAARKYDENWPVSASDLVRSFDVAFLRVCADCTRVCAHSVMRKSWHDLIYGKKGRSSRVYAYIEANISAGQNHLSS